MSAQPCIETIPLGASLFHFHVPPTSSSSPPSDSSNIILSFPTPSLFASIPHPHFGNTVGRITNRINNATLNLNNKTYSLAKNDGNNNLHGGNKGWGKQIWKGPQTVRRGKWDGGVKDLTGKGGEGSAEEREGLLYEYDSPDGDEGFPGDVEAKVWYFEGRGAKGEVVLDVEYEARLSEQEGKNQGVEETVIGMTNHAYFNLNPPSTSNPTPFLSYHTATLSTPTHLPLSSSAPGIPSGSLAPHPNVPAQSNTPFPLTNPPSAPSTSPESIVQIDDCFVLNTSPKDIPLDTRPLPLRTLATLRGDLSGINLRVESTEPAFQFYTGLWVDVPKWDGGEGYGKGAGVCVEPSRYVDAAGREEWRGMCLLKKGGVFGARSRYVGWRD